MISVPKNWPTHKGEPKFWEELGRTVATFTTLEDILPRFYLAITGSRNNKEFSEEDVKIWVAKLDKSLSDTLGGLIEKVREAFGDDERIEKEIKFEIITRLEGLKVWRNVLCHGAWVGFENDGSAQLRFFRKLGDKETEQLCNSLSLRDVNGIRSEIVEVIIRMCEVANAIGVQLPGSNLPGIDLREQQ